MENIENGVPSVQPTQPAATPSPMKKMIIALIAILVVGSVGAMTFLKFSAPKGRDPNEPPPSLQIADSGLKGSFIEKDQNLYQFEPSDRDVFAASKLALQSAYPVAGAIQPGINYMFADRAISMGEIVKGIDPVSNRLLLAYYTPGEDGKAAGFYTYPRGPFTGTNEIKKEELSSFIIPANRAIVVMSEVTSSSYGLLDAAKKPAADLTSAPLADTASGWVLVSAKDQNLANVIASYKDRVISAYALKNQTDFERVDMSSTTALSTYSVAWLNLNPKTVTADTTTTTTTTTDTTTTTTISADPTLDTSAIITLVHGGGPGVGGKYITLTGTNLPTKVTVGDPAIATWDMNITEPTGTGFGIAMLPLTSTSLSTEFKFSIDAMNVPAGTYNLTITAGTKTFIQSVKVTDDTTIVTTDTGDQTPVITAPTDISFSEPKTDTMFTADQAAKGIAFTLTSANVPSATTTHLKDASGSYYFNYSWTLTKGMETAVLWSATSSTEKNGTIPAEKLTASGQYTLTGVLANGLSTDTTTSTKTAVVQFTIKDKDPAKLVVTAPADISILSPAPSPVLELATVQKNGLEFTIDPLTNTTATEKNSYLKNDAKQYFFNYRFQLYAPGKSEAVWDSLWIDKTKFPSAKATDTTCIQEKITNEYVTGSEAPAKDLAIWTCPSGVISAETIKSLNLKGGSYDFVATIGNGGATAQAPTTFTIKDTTPGITVVSPTSIKFNELMGKLPIEVTLTGVNLDKVTKIDIGELGNSVGAIKSVTSTSAVMTVGPFTDVAKTPAVGTVHKITFFATKDFTDGTDSKQTITVAPPAPKLINIETIADTAPGATFTLTVTGENFPLTATPTITASGLSGSGIDFSDIKVKDSTTFTATGRVDAKAVNGERTIEVSLPDANPSSITKNMVVNANSVAPKNGEAAPEKIGFHSPLKGKKFKLSELTTNGLEFSIIDENNKSSFLKKVGSETYIMAYELSLMDTKKNIKWTSIKPSGADAERYNKCYMSVLDYRDNKKIDVPVWTCKVGEIGKQKFTNELFKGGGEFIFSAKAFDGNKYSAPVETVIRVFDDVTKPTPKPLTFTKPKVTSTQDRFGAITVVNDKYTPADLVKGLSFDATENNNPVSSVSYMVDEKFASRLNYRWSLKDPDGKMIWNSIKNYNKILTPAGKKDEDCLMPLTLDGDKVTANAIDGKQYVCTSGIIPKEVVTKLKSSGKGLYTLTSSIGNGMNTKSESDSEVKFGVVIYKPTITGITSPSYCDASNSNSRVVTIDGTNFIGTEVSITAQDGTDISDMKTQIDTLTDTSIKITVACSEIAKYVGSEFDLKVTIKVTNNDGNSAEKNITFNVTPFDDGTIKPKIESIVFVSGLDRCDAVNKLVMVEVKGSGFLATTIGVTLTQMEIEQGNDIGLEKNGGTFIPPTIDFEKNGNGINIGSSKSMNIVMRCADIVDMEYRYIGDVQRNGKGVGGDEIYDASGKLIGPDDIYPVKVVDFNERLKIMQDNLHEDIVLGLFVKAKGGSDSKDFKGTKTGDYGQMIGDQNFSAIIRTYSESSPLNK